MKKGLFLILLFSIQHSTFNICFSQTLRQLADKDGINFGCAAFPSDETKYLQIIKDECNIIVPENCMKFENTEPKPGIFTFGQGDKLVRFAEENNIKLRGHCLVWHQQLPDWVKNGTFTRKELLQVMKKHIKSLLTHYKGKMVEWDVVNEAIDDSTHFLRKTIWQKLIGDDYIDSAFIFAHKADPNALFFYNDYGIEDLNAKSDAVYSMLKRMKAQSIPVNGIGFQFHIPLNGVPVHMRENLKRFADLGLRISITELDVRIDEPVDEVKLQQQKENYKEIMKIFLSMKPASSSLLTWGITDKFSWIPAFFKGYGDALPFDKDYNKKPAYYGLMESLIKN